jgi:hypothetical protein
MKGSKATDETPNPTTAQDTAQAAAPDTSRALTGDDILNLNDVVVERVDVPEWGGHVFVRTLSAEAKEQYIESIRRITGRGKKQNVEIILEKSSAKLAAQTMCKEDGTLLWPNGSMATIDRLAARSAKALSRVVDAAAKLNGLADDSEEEAGKD